jgi:hypothetical protein
MKATAPMISAAIVLFLAIAVALFAARRPMAEIQANLLGGRIVPGCVIAEAAIIALMALAVFLLRRYLD